MDRFPAHFRRKRSLAGAIAGFFVCALLMVSALTFPAAAQTGGAGMPAAPGHGAWSAFLETYVVTGDDGIARVRYGEVTAADRTALADYIAHLASMPVSTFPRDDQMAFWINLYNALTVQLILDHYPVRSIRQIKFGNFFAFGPWTHDLITVEGETLSLDNIEHDILRPRFADNRVHYAINCASLGCPNLAATAYLGNTLDAQLNEAARQYVNHPRGAFVDARGRLTISSIYTWFAEDFGGTEEQVIVHLRLYTEPELSQTLGDRTEIDRYDYDWALNDARE